MAALDPIVIAFGVEGMNRVAEAFKELEHMVSQVEKNMVKVTQSASKERVKTTETEAKKRSKSTQDESKDHEKEEKKATKTHEKEEKERTKNAIKAQKEREKAHKKSLDDMGKREKEVAKARSEMMSSSLGISSSRAKTVGNALGGGSGAAATGVGIMVGVGAALAAFSLLEKGISLATSALEQFGSYVIHEVIQPDLKNETLSQQISNRSNGAMTKEQIQGSAKVTALANNMAEEDILKGVARFVDATGDLKAAFEVSDTASKAAKAHGADVVSLMNVLGQARAANPNQSASDDKSLLLHMMQQSQMGKISTETMANLGGKLFESSSLLTGNGAENQRKMTGFVQIAARNTGTADQAAENMNVLFRDVASGNLKGFKFKDKAGKINVDPAQMVSQMVAKFGSDMSKMKAAGLSDPGAKALLNFAAISDAAGGGKKGAQAVFDETSKFEHASMTQDQASNQRASVLSTTGEKLTATIADINASILSDFKPIFSDLVERFAEAKPMIVDFIHNGLAPMAKKLVAAVSQINLEPLAKALAETDWGALINGFVFVVKELVGLLANLSFAIQGLPFMGKDTSGISSDPDADNTKSMPASIKKHQVEEIDIGAPASADKFAADMAAIADRLGKHTEALDKNTEATKANTDSTGKPINRSLPLSHQ